MVSDKKNDVKTTLRTFGDYTNKVMLSLKSTTDSIDKAMSTIQESVKGFERLAFTLSEYFKYNKLVPPQVYDFLVKIKVPLPREKIEELKKLETRETRKLYTIYTRKTKGRKIYNPQFFVEKEMFNAINVILKRNKSSVAVESSIVYFDAEARILNVYGMVTYMKKDSDRYRLCNYLFGKKRGPREWEVRDIVEALGDRERVFDPQKRKKSYDWVNGKIRELNKDIKDSIGIEELVSYEEAKFVLNSVNKP